MIIMAGIMAVGRHGVGAVTGSSHDLGAEGKRKREGGKEGGEGEEG